MAQLIVGENDLNTVNPDLASQWHPTLNEPLKPHNFTAKSGKKVWWECALKHEWQAVIGTRAIGRGCPYCAGKRVLRGFNDLASTHPELASQWHPNENGALTPFNVASKSHHKVWWQCFSEHVWKAEIASRSSSGNGCPYCSGRLRILGLTDLATTNPELAAQWHPTKNETVTPRDVTLGSEKKAWWICESKHEWEAIINSRSRGNGCPYCRGFFPIVGSTDLATVNPELAAQWHPTKNGKLTPQNVTTGSYKKVWWICSLHNEWEALISNRSKGTGCPKCSVGLTERNFQEALEMLSKANFASDRIDLIRSTRKYTRAQIDMLNDDLRLVIEYDGEWTHGARSPEGKTLHQKLAEDKETTQALVDIGYKVIRIREHSKKGMLPLVPLDKEYDSNVFQITYKSFGTDKDIIEHLTQKIIDEKKDWFKVEASLDMA